MADVKRSSEFRSHFQKRANKNVRALFEKRFKLFQKNPHDPALKIHPLKYEWEGYFSFSLTADEGGVSFSKLEISQPITTP